MFSLERAYYLSDKALSRFAEQLEDVLQRQKLVTEMDQEKQARLQRVQAAVQRRQECSKQTQEEAREAQERELRIFQQQQAKVAQQSMKVTQARLKGALQYTSELTARVKDTFETQQADRREAVLELKVNSDQVRREVAGQAERYVSAQKARERALEESKEELLAQGKNPYIEFRRNEIESEARRRESRLIKKVEQKQKDLAAKLQAEQTFTDKRERAQRQAAQYEREHRESLGRHVIEERTRQYLVKMTAEHTEVLDP
ncbi:hypothetical protein EON64_04340, partial [archaeon]